MGWLSSGTAEVKEDSCEYQTLTREWGNVWKLRTRTRVEEIRGLTRSAALAYGTDVAYYTVTNGQLYFAHFTRSVRRYKANAADGWRVVVTKKWSAAYENSTWKYGAASSYFSAENPSDMTS